MTDDLKVKERELTGDWTINGEPIADKKWVLSKILNSGDVTFNVSPPAGTFKGEWVNWVEEGIKTALARSASTDKVIKEIIVEKPIEHTKETIIEKELVEKDANNIVYIESDTTLNESHVGKYVIANSNKDIIITVPDTFKNGESVDVFRESGNVTFQVKDCLIKGVGFNIAYKYGCVTLKKINPSEWHLIGALN
jgi:hypothetical protein